MNPTRKELHAFQRQEITFKLSNGMSMKAPAMACIVAILNVLTQEQQTRVFNILTRQGVGPVARGAMIDIPDISHLKGVLNGHTF